MVMAKPAVIHFGGFEVDKKQTISLSIVNVSTEVIRMHIIPPQTKYFYVKYTKNVSQIDTPIFYFFLFYAWHKLLHCINFIYNQVYYNIDINVCCSLWWNSDFRRGWCQDWPWSVQLSSLLMNGDTTMTVLELTVQ